MAGNDAYEKLRETTVKTAALVLQIVNDDEQLARRFLDTCMSEAVGQRAQAKNILDILNWKPPR